MSDNFIKLAKCEHCCGTGQPNGVMGGPNLGLCSYCGGSGHVPAPVPSDIDGSPDEIERLKRCISMAMGCINPEATDRDLRLAWFRLADALNGDEPRAALATEA